MVLARGVFRFSSTFFPYYFRLILGILKRIHLLHATSSLTYQHTIKNTLEMHFASFSFFFFNSVLLYAVLCVCVFMDQVFMKLKKKYIGEQKKGWPPTIEWKKACEKTGIMMLIACNYEYFFPSIFTLECINSAFFVLLLLQYTFKYTYSAYYTMHGIPLISVWVRISFESDKFCMCVFFFYTFTIFHHCFDFFLFGFVFIFVFFSTVCARFNFSP